jgi:hypothetical protein
MTEFEPELATMLHDAVPAPTVVIDYEAVQHKARRRRRTAQLVPLAVVSILAIPITVYALAPGSSSQHRIAGNTPPATNSATSTPPAGLADCPPTRYLANSAVAIDYVDFVQLYHRQYLADATSPSGSIPAQLGPVAAHVRCTISDLTQDGRHEVIGAYRDGDAAFLPVGTDLHSVAGYDPQCRIAAEHGGSTTTYLAQHEVNHHSVPLPCAVEPKVGGAYPFRLYSHCGIHYAQFAGRTWTSVKTVPEPASRPDANGTTRYFGYTPGTMTLIDANTLLFTIDLTKVDATVKTVTFHPTSKPPPGCD